MGGGGRRRIGCPLPSCASAHPPLTPKPQPFWHLPPRPHARTPTSAPPGACTCPPPSPLPRPAAQLAVFVIASIQAQTVLLMALAGSLLSPAASSSTIKVWWCGWRALLGSMDRPCASACKRCADAVSHRAGCLGFSLPTYFDPVRAAVDRGGASLQVSISFPVAPFAPAPFPSLHLHVLRPVSAPGHTPAQVNAHAYDAQTCALVYAHRCPGWAPARAWRCCWRPWLPPPPSCGPCTATRPGHGCCRTCR